MPSQGGWTQPTAVDGDRVSAAYMPGQATCSVGGRRRCWHKQGAVSCTCGAPRTDGFPCVHNVKHALHIGRDPCDFVHYLDTTEAWEHQYDQDDEFPVIGPEQYDKADFDKNLQYPPVPPPKVGRPKKEGRIKGGKEKAMASERKRALPVCSACNKAGHISTNSKCEKYKARGQKKKK